VAAIIAYIGSNWMSIAITILLIDRVLERIFPNATILKKIDMLLGQAGIQPPSS
jgi:hypothetical protein